MRRFPLLLALATSAPLVGQASIFSVPGTATPSVGTCNAFPFGSTSSTSSFANCRYQTLVEAADLGSLPLVICGLRFAPCGTGMRSFDQILVQMASTPLTTLTTTFDTNLPPGTGTTVLDARNYVWHNVADTWNDIGLQDIFVADGVNNVIIDITVTNAVFTASGGGATSASFHRDTRQRVYATSYTGQPTGSSGSAALSLQLHFADATTWTYGAGCTGSNGIPALSFSGRPVLGQSFSVDLASGPSQSAAFLVIGVSNRPPLFPIDLGIIGAPGCNLSIEPLISIGATTDAAGAASTTIPIAAQTTPCDVVFYMQWLSIDVPANPLGLTASNYGRVLAGY